jgi:hypothetical protein
MFVALWLFNDAIDLPVAKVYGFEQSGKMCKVTCLDWGSVLIFRSCALLKKEAVCSYETWVEIGDSSGMLRRVVSQNTDVSEVLTASIVRAMRIEAVKTSETSVSSKSIHGATSPWLPIAHMCTRRYNPEGQRRQEYSGRKITESLGNVTVRG